MTDLYYYKVSYNYSDDDSMYYFYCRASDEEHAIEQFLDAEPNGLLFSADRIEKSSYPFG